jgi:hypothetical protein
MINSWYLKGPARAHEAQQANRKPAADGLHEREDRGRGGAAQAEAA